MAEPKRTTLRKLIDAPRSAKSNTDRDEPTRAIPNNESAAPILAKLRKDIDEPISEKANTESADPRRE
jgi:hypothetical protein